MFDLSNKVCLITGSYGYLASYFVEDLCKYNAIVILSGRNINKLNEQYNLLKKKYNNIVKIMMDITNKDDIKKCIAEIKERFNRLDIIINNANIARSINNLSNKTDEDLKVLFDVNTIGPFNIIKEAIPLLIDTSKHFNVLPSIINFTSIYSSFSPKKHIYPDLKSINPIEYGISKASLFQLTKYFAAYYGDVNLRFNCISPGCFPNLENYKDDDEFIENLKEKSPMHKIGKPKDLSGLIIFLSSDSSSFITGQNIFIDGGANCWI